MPEEDIPNARQGFFYVYTTARGVDTLEAFSGSTRTSKAIGENTDSYRCSWYYRRKLLIPLKISARLPRTPKALRALHVSDTIGDHSYRY